MPKYAYVYIYIYIYEYIHIYIYMTCMYIMYMYSLSAQTKPVMVLLHVSFCLCVFGVFVFVRFRNVSFTFRLGRVCDDVTCLLRFVCVCVQVVFTFLLCKQHSYSCACLDNTFADAIPGHRSPIQPRSTPTLCVLSATPYIYNWFKLLNDSSTNL